MPKPPTLTETAVSLGEAAKQLLTPESAPEGSPYGWNLTDATQRLDHLEKHTKTELLAALAYLTCQYHGIRAEKPDAEARLALVKIESALKRYKEGL